MPETRIGEVVHYFSNISVAVLDLSQTLRVGDSIRIKGNTTDFQQTVESMQVQHEDVQEGQPGQELAVRVVDRVRQGDEVFNVEKASD